MRVVAYLDKDPRPAMQREFLRVGSRIASQYGGDLWPIRTGRDLARIATQYADREVDHLIVVCHGGTTWLVNSRVGVHRFASSSRGQISVGRLAEVWAPRLTTRPLISLCACMCSRSPSWQLALLGTNTSAWGPQGYNGLGTESFSAKLRDELVRRCIRPQVRGHGTVGHVTGNPILREHAGDIGSAGTTLYRLVHPDIEPGIMARRQWVRLVKGELAERWLLGDDAVEMEIAMAWR